MEALHSFTWETMDVGSASNTSIFQGLDVAGTARQQDFAFLEDITGDNFDLETTLLRMKELKERAAHLPDNERRELAASFALKFAQMLGDDEDSM